MKQKLFNIFMLVAATVALASCGSDDSEGLTRITYYPVLEILGDSYLVIDKGSNYVDPGYTATLDGEDVTDQVTVKSTVNTAQSGVYTVTYSIVNADGIAANARRTVVVLDPNNAIEGFYLTDPVNSYRIYGDGAPVAFGGAFELLVFDNGDGTITISDLMGGWYDQRADYGSNYALKGVVEVAAGSLSLIDSYVPGWGDGAEELTGSWDEATGTLTWDVVYTDTPILFHVIANKE